MVDIVYFAGTERMDFEGQVGTVLTSTSTVGRRSTYSRVAIQLQPGADNANYLPCPFSAAATEFWVHAELYMANQSTNKFLKFYSAGALKFGLAYISSTSFGVYTWNGSAWTLVLTCDTTAIGTWTNTTVDFDMHVKVGNPGILAIYWGGVPVGVTTTIDLSAITNIDEMRIQNSAASAVFSYCSEIIITNFNTIGSYIKSDAPTGNSATNTAFTNDYTFVDESTDGGTDYITSATANQRETYTFPSITLGANEAIAAVGVGIEAFVDVSSPQNINLAARTAATDYDGPDRTLATSLTYRQMMWSTNPNTSAAWAATEVNATELGVRSRA